MLSVQCVHPTDTRQVSIRDDRVIKGRRLKVEQERIDETSSPCKTGQTWSG